MDQIIRNSARTVSQSPSWEAVVLAPLQLDQKCLVDVLGHLDHWMHIIRLPVYDIMQILLMLLLLMLQSPLARCVRPGAKEWSGAYDLHFPVVPLFATHYPCFDTDTDRSACIG